jgi:hypothetical protein
MKSESLKIHDLYLPAPRSATRLLQSGQARQAGGLTEEEIRIVEREAK